MVPGAHPRLSARPGRVLFDPGGTPSLLRPAGPQPATLIVSGAGAARQLGWRRPAALIVPGEGARPRHSAGGGPQPASTEGGRAPRPLRSAGVFVSRAGARPRPPGRGDSPIASEGGQPHPFGGCGRTSASRGVRSPSSSSRGTRAGPASGTEAGPYRLGGRAAWQPPSARGAGGLVVSRFPCRDPGSRHGPYPIRPRGGSGGTPSASRPTRPTPPSWGRGELRTSPPPTAPESRTRPPRTPTRLLCTPNLTPPHPPAPSGCAPRTLGRAWCA